MVSVQIAQSYREDLRDRLRGTAGDEAARAKIERWLNERVSSGFMVCKPSSIDYLYAAYTL